MAAEAQVASVKGRLRGSAIIEFDSCCSGVLSIINALTALSGTFLGAILVTLIHVPVVAAALDWSAVLEKSREIAMSRLVGFLDTDLLFLQPGSSQDEIFRLLQGMLGIGALRVVFKIAMAPCLRFIHEACGRKPPEPIEAREFWLEQEGWTEMKGIGLNEEDTRYHRVNQGSGPQAKILWNHEELKTERRWWQYPDRREMSWSPSDSTIAPSLGPRLSDASPGSEIQNILYATSSTTVKGNEELTRVRSTAEDQSAPGFAQEKDRRSKPVDMPHAPGIFQTRSGEGLVQGTTIKWWIDRWQCEVLAVASIQGLTLKQACDLLSFAYFGTDAGPKRHMTALVAVVSMTATTLVMAILTQWSWICQFFSLSLLGYFLTWTSSLRSWRFEPNPHLENFRPRLLNEWPGNAEKSAFIRIAVQNARMCHLRALIPVDTEQLEKAKSYARNMRGRYYHSKATVPAAEKPYNDADDKKVHWISYQIEGSYYGLIASVEPDHALRRTASILLSLVISVLLLFTGFGADVPQPLGPYILGIYALGFVGAVPARGKSAKWTLPEYGAVDLTNMEVTKSVRERICLLSFAAERLHDQTGPVAGGKSQTSTV